MEKKDGGITEEKLNKELQDWIKEAHKVPNKESEESCVKKEPKGQCEICGNNISKFICLKCEKSVCPSCYFKLIGICKECINQEVMDKWEGKTPDWEQILGVQWVD